ncbi:MAG: Stk1 family PASTA domain-containing Ser/Thr kinase [Lachnospiraceae bacterium]|nr:Stk1 family PASTA domain-containing Ser/Thr kinase [Lachnospiraceae bacterium]
MLRAGIFLGDRYEIMERIGSGGMADVFKGKDHKLNRFVAIKVMKQEYKGDKEFVSKFRVEAQAAAGLTHTNIVSIYDVGEDSGLYYIVMELVEGITLKKYIEKKGRLTVKEAITIAIQISMGIEAAHNNHIIHRDIKPQNILISKDGKVKVTDFGIAKAATSNTINSSVMGSVHYSSPEQAKGRFSTEKSDIYSLGITMYEMLAGSPPYDGDTTVSIAVQHIQEPFPSIREEVPDIPVSLERIIEKCTMKSADRRYQNMGALIMDLKQSLLTPHSDFVEMAENENANGATIRMTEKQLQDMKKQLHSKGKQNVQEEEPEEDEEEENEDDLNPTLEKVLTGLGIVAAVLVVGIAVYAGFSLFSSMGGDSDNPNIEATEEPSATGSALAEDEVQMISLLGMTYDEAQKALNDLELGIDEGEPINSDKYEKGQVAQQSVAKDTIVKKHETIEVSLSKGAGAMTIPADLVGKSSSEVQNALEEMGLIVDPPITEYSNSVPMNNVISIDPPSGSEINRGDTVKIVVSRGKQKVSVPSLTNKTKEEAEAELKARGLSLGNVTTSERLSENVEAGRVISQNYSSGSNVDYGTAVDIVLSKGMAEAVWKGSLRILKTDLPEGFESGNVRFELIQVVDGTEKSKVVKEGTMTSSDFPYALQMTGEKSVASGRVLIYIDGQKVDGEHSVVFTEE